MRQFSSIVGAILILVPFAASQLGRLKTSSRPYQLMNLLGAGTLTAVAGVWTIMSMIGLYRVTVRRGDVRK